MSRSRSPRPLGSAPRQRLLSLPLLAVFLFLFALVYTVTGCSSGGTFPYRGGGEVIADTRAFGAVEGFLVRGTGRANELSIRPQAPSLSSDALANATVQILDGTGALQTRTDARGYFKIPAVPAGLRRLKADAVGVGTGEFPLTVLADVTVQVGEQAVTRAQAIAKAKDALAAAGVDLATIRLMAAQQPFPGGVRIAPTYVDPEREDVAAVTRTLAAPSWFVYADLHPGQHFVHSVRYFYIDVASGALASDERESFPAVNGRIYYGDDVVNITSPDLVQNPTRAAAVTRHAPTFVPLGGTREKAAALAAASANADVPCRESAPRSAATRGRDHDVPPCEDPRVYTLLINGDLRPDMALDVSNMETFLRNGGLAGMGTPEIFTYRPPTEGIVPARMRIEQILDTINGVARPCDTLFIYASSHGSRLGGIIVERGPKTDGTGAVSVPAYIYPEFLALNRTPACHIVLVMDCCFSGQAVANFKKHVTERDDLYTGKKVIAMAAAGPQQWSFGDPGESGIFFDGPPKGGYFTNAFFEAANEFSQITGQPVGLSSLMGVFNVAEGITNVSTFKFTNAPEDYPVSSGQDPEFWERVLKPGETCGSGPVPSPSPVTMPSPSPSPVTMPNRAPTLARMSNVFLPDLHTNAFQVDATDPDGDTLTYEWTWTGPATQCGANQGEGSGGPKTHLFLHEGCSFAAENATTVTVTVRDGKGGVATHSLGLRQEGVFDIP